MEGKGGEIHGRIMFGEWRSWGRTGGKGKGGKSETYVHMPCWRRRKVRSELWIMWTE